MMLIRLVLYTKTIRILPSPQQIHHLRAITGHEVTGMSQAKRIEKWRSWFPIPVEGRSPQLIQWILLDGSRYAVSLWLLVLTFVSTLAVGSVWTFEMQTLLTETQAVQTILVSFMSGIILLVSIVVSINSIVLSHDITAISNQEERIEGIIGFRRDVGQIASTDQTPTDPKSFLSVMAEVIQEQAHALQDVDREVDEEFSDDIEEYASKIGGITDELKRSLELSHGGEFRALWLGLEMDYGPMMNSMRDFVSTYRDQLSEDKEDQFEELIHLIELFATGQEYFKTLYYSREITDLSRTLLITSLPAIIITVWSILAINADLLPKFWLFGLPSLQTFVALSFTIALAPFIILTAYMLRVATVTRRTAVLGPFNVQ